MNLIVQFGCHFHKWLKSVCTEWDWTLRNGVASFSCGVSVYKVKIIISSKNRACSLLLHKGALCAVYVLLSRIISSELQPVALITHCSDDSSTLFLCKHLPCGGACYSLRAAGKPDGTCSRRLRGNTERKSKGVAAASRGNQRSPTFSVGSHTRAIVRHARHSAKGIWAGIGPSDEGERSTGGSHVLHGSVAFLSLLPDCVLLLQSAKLLDWFSFSFCFPDFVL